MLVISFGAAAQTAPILTAPATGATGEATALTLAWRSEVAAASYSVRVATSSTFAVLSVNQSGITGNSLPISGLSTGTVYYWEVNATNAAGTLTSAWSTVDRFTTGAAVAVPAVPILDAPSNGAAGEPTSLTLSWTTEPRATSYEAQVSTISTFATTVIDEAGLTNHNAEVSGLSGGITYYWRADASNAAGTSAWSDARMFTTELTLAAPMLISPKSGMTGEGSSVTLTWGSVSGAASYTVQVSTVEGSFNTGIVYKGLATTSYALGGLADNTIYYWEIEAVQGAVTSAWSTVSDFVVDYSATLSGTVATTRGPSLAIKDGIISYTLNRSDPVALAVYDIRGRTVFSVNRVQAAGNYSLNLTGHSLAPGRYFVWFKSGSFEKRAAMEITGNR